MIGLMTMMKKSKQTVQLKVIAAQDLFPFPFYSFLFSVI